MVVKNFDPATTQAELVEFFASYGTLSNVRMNKDSSVCFVSYLDTECARMAKEHASRHFLRGRRLNIRYSEPLEKRKIGYAERNDKRAQNQQHGQEQYQEKAELTKLITGIGVLLNLGNNSTDVKQDVFALNSVQ